MTLKLGPEQMPALIKLSLVGYGSPSQEQKELRSKISMCVYELCETPNSIINQGSIFLSLSGKNNACLS